MKISSLFFSIPLGLMLLFSCAKDPSSDTSLITPPEVDTGALPYIRITTDVAIENEPKVPGDMAVFENQTLRFSAPVGIEYRGSTSFRLSDKKSYGIETWDENDQDVNASILGFPEEEDWILTGHVFRSSSNTIFDPSLMHHYIGYELYRSMGRYASRSKFVELEVNQDYLGTYIFMEKLKRDNHRIDLAKMTPADNELPNVTGGYILKIDKTAGGDVAPNEPLSYYYDNWGDDARYSEAISFRSNYDIYGNLLNTPAFDPPYHSGQFLETYFLYEYPKSEEITSAQKQYIQTYLNDFETALLEDDFTTDHRTYTQFIDLDSFVDFFIINEITGNIDGYRISTYLNKERGSKLKMGPIWDLNIGYNRQNRVPFTDWIAHYNNYVDRDAWMVPFWWPRLLQDPVFQQRLKQRWQTLRSNQLSTTTVLGLVQSTADYLIENGAIERNYERWNGLEVDYEQSIVALKSYLDDRLNWMDEQINAF